MAATSSGPTTEATRARLAARSLAAMRLSKTARMAFTRSASAARTWSFRTFPCPVWTLAVAAAALLLWISTISGSAIWLRHWSSMETTFSNWAACWGSSASALRSVAVSASKLALPAL